MRYKGFQMTELENVQPDERLTFVVYILLCIIVSSGLVAAYSVGSSIATKLLSGSL